MRRLGGNGFQRLLARIPRPSLLPWKDVLLLAFVAMAVACSVAFAGLRLQQIAEGRDDAELGRLGGADGLPDVLGNRCLNQASQRL